MEMGGGTATRPLQPSQHKNLGDQQFRVRGSWRGRVIISICTRGTQKLRTLLLDQVSQLVARIRNIRICFYSEVRFMTGAEWGPVLGQVKQRQTIRSRRVASFPSCKRLLSRTFNSTWHETDPNSPTRLHRMSRIPLVWLSSLVTNRTSQFPYLGILVNKTLQLPQVPQQKKDTVEK